MKNWIKIIIGLVVGAIIGAILPAKSSAIMSISKFLAELSINVGKYVFIPYIFFAFAMEVSELNRNKKLLKSFLLAFAYMAVNMLILVGVGVFLTLVLSQKKLSYIFSDLSTVKIPSLGDYLLSIYPENILDVFFNPYGIAVPVLVAATIIGINFAFDRIITKPVVQFFDSFSKILNHISTLSIELLGFSITFFTAFFIMQLKTNQKIGYDMINLILFLVIETSIIIFIIYPLILFFFFKVKNPYKTIFALFVPALTTFFCGDVIYGHAVASKFNERNLGIDQESNSFYNSLFSGIFRAGTAMITASVFLIILKSQSSLTINLSSVLVTIILSIALSFYTSTIPVYGVFFSLVVMCQNYGVIKNDAYNLIIPILPVLYGLSAMLDVISSSLCTMLIAKSDRTLKDVKVSDYI